MSDTTAAAAQSVHLLYSNRTTWRKAVGYAQEAVALLQRDPDSPIGHYALAAIAEFRGDLALTEAHLLRTGLRIGMDYDDYSLVVHRSFEKRYLEGAAARQGIAPRFILSLPKSGSTFVAECFARLAGLPRARVSKGSFTTGRIIPPWLETFGWAGGVLHDHFPASPENRERLQARPPQAVVLLVRDPVTAAMSMADFILSEGMDKFFARELGEADLSYVRALPPELQRSVLFQKLFPRMAAWIDGWLDFVAGGAMPGSRFALVRFEDLVADNVRVLAALEQHFDGRGGRFDANDAACLREVEALYAGLRETQGNLMSVHRGRRQVVLGDVEKELVWRAFLGHRHLRQVYDLSGHLT
mgnify:CR=1 FL=1